MHGFPALIGFILEYLGTIIIALLLCSSVGLVVSIRWLRGNRYAWAAKKAAMGVLAGLCAAILIGIGFVAASVAMAATEHEDGSITLSKDEKEAVESMVNHLLQQRQFLQMERGGAMEAIKEMQKKIESLEKSKCI
jgi:hypothetical protein